MYIGYKQDACYINSELPSSEIVAFKNICTIFAKWSSNPDWHLWSYLFLKVTHGLESWFAYNLTHPVLLALVCTHLYVAIHRDTESTLPVGSCNLGMEGAAGRSASRWGSSWKSSSGGLYCWDFPAVPHGIVFTLSSRLHHQVCLDPCGEGDAELGLGSSFHMGVHVKNVDYGWEMLQACVAIVLIRQRPP